MIDLPVYLYSDPCLFPSKYGYLWVMIALVFVTEHRYECNEIP